MPFSGKLSNFLKLHSKVNIVGQIFHGGFICICNTIIVVFEWHDDINIAHAVARLMALW